MTEQPEDTTAKYEESVAGFDPNLDDPEDDSTGYENDVDAEGDEAAEAEVVEEGEEP